MRNWLGLCAATCLVGVVSGLPTVASAADAETYGNWTAKCEAAHDGKEGGCFLLQNLVLRDGGQRVLQVAVGYVPNASEPIALLSLPLGISLPPGVSLRVSDHEPVQIPVERCEPNGCRAGLKLKDDLLRALRDSTQITVVFHDAQRHPIEVPVKLEGFAKGLDALHGRSSPAAPKH
ncbi:MAG: invasion associated locus B family protein [Gammaproteobacteria bacterium]|nr:invasion associated locus B family protein [Gammaproteobacteria bacterium]